MIASDRIHADLYTRQPSGQWLLTPADRPEDTLELESIGCRLTLADIYLKVRIAGSAPAYSRLIRLATYPAPNPLSIFTTVTLLAQLLSIPSSAARPWKLAP